MAGQEGDQPRQLSEEQLFERAPEYAWRLLDGHLQEHGRGDGGLVPTLVLLSVPPKIELVPELTFQVERKERERRVLELVPDGQAFVFLCFDAPDQPQEQSLFWRARSDGSEGEWFAVPIEEEQGQLQLGPFVSVEAPNPWTDWRKQPPGNDVVVPPRLEEAESPHALQEAWYLHNHEGNSFTPEQGSGSVFLDSMLATASFALNHWDEAGKSRRYIGFLAWWGMFRAWKPLTLPDGMEPPDARMYVHSAALDAKADGWCLVEMSNPATQPLRWVSVGLHQTEYQAAGLAPVAVYWEGWNDYAFELQHELRRGRRHNEDGSFFEPPPAPQLDEDAD